MQNMIRGGLNSVIEYEMDRKVVGETYVTQILQATSDLVVVIAIEKNKTIIKPVQAWGLCEVYKISDNKAQLLTPIYPFIIENGVLEPVLDNGLLVGVFSKENKNEMDEAIKAYFKGNPKFTA